MQKIKSILRHWLPLALITVAMCALIYLIAQQSLRWSANDPQIQWAEDAAATLGEGGSLSGIAPDVKVDIARSLAPFLIVYDERGEVLASSGFLHKKPPVLPGGVLDYVKQHGEDRISWQPEPGVRIAAVVTGYNGEYAGYVLAGRSLKEVEIREDQVFKIAAAACLVTLISSLVLVILCEYTLSYK
jgi:hypothetical protein